MGRKWSVSLWILLEGEPPAGGLYELGSAPHSRRESSGFGRALDKSALPGLEPDRKGPLGRAIVRSLCHTLVILRGMDTAKNGGNFSCDYCLATVEALRLLDRARQDMGGTATPYERAYNWAAYGRPMAPQDDPLWWAWPKLRPVEKAQLRAIGADPPTTRGRGARGRGIKAQLVLCGVTSRSGRAPKVESWIAFRLVATIDLLVRHFDACQWHGRSNPLHEFRELWSEELRTGRPADAARRTFVRREGAAVLGVSARTVRRVLAEWKPIALDGAARSHLAPWIGLPAAPPASVIARLRRFTASGQ